MNQRLFAASILSAAVGIAFSAAGLPAQAAGMNEAGGMSHAGSMSQAGGMSHEMPKIVKDNMMKMESHHLQKCYGINAVAKNDCAEGAHSCAGQATQARDPKSFVLLPAGDCSKIQGGRTTAA